MSWWRNYPTRVGRRSQNQLIAEALRQPKAARRPLSLPEILTLGVAQFTARIFELRAEGFEIENSFTRQTDGTIHSAYSLKHDPERDGAQ